MGADGRRFWSARTCPRFWSGRPVVPTKSGVTARAGHSETHAPAAGAAVRQCVTVSRLATRPRERAGNRAGRSDRTRLDSAGRNGIGAANKERWQADAGILVAGHARARSIAKGFCDEQATPPAAKRTSQVATFIYLRLLMSKNQHGRGHPGAGPPGRNPPHS
jgi:hypothetical protein